MVSKVMSIVARNSSLRNFGRMVFDGVTNDLESTSEPTSSASSTVLAQRAARRATATAAAST